VQATIFRYDPRTGGGTCVLDDGLELDVAPGALAGSGLRHLRPGQRVTVTVVEDGVRGTYVDSVRIVGVTP
jgi:2-phospho-L-lactate guanylyltransferase